MRHPSLQRRHRVSVSNLYYKRYDLDLDLTTALGPSTKKKVASQYKVRTSHHDRTLDSMFPVAHPSQITNTQKQSGTQAKGQPNTSKEIKETECYLASVIALRANILANRHIRVCHSQLCTVNLCLLRHSRAFGYADPSCLRWNR